jgi:hypothetical protein
LPNSFFTVIFLSQRDLAGVAVDGDDAAIGDVGDDLVLPERDPARPRGVPLVRHAGVGNPRERALVAGTRVDLVDRSPAVARVHEAVVDERVHLGLGAVLPHVLHAAERDAPHHPQILDVGPVDLRQLGVAETVVVPVHQEPVLRLVLGIEQPLLVDGERILAQERGRRRRDGERARQEGEESQVTAHRCLPL